MNDKTKNLVILGSTGSIGKQALEIVAQHQDKFKVIGLAALDEVDELSRQVDKFKPQMIALGDANKYGQARKALAGKTAISVGVEGMCELAGLEAADIVLVAVSGAVGILPTLEAVKNGKRVALANKETLVAAGEIVMQEVVARHIELIPVDSEHSAIFQCLQSDRQYLRYIWLTASGGPFREFSLAQLEKVTVEMALRHPNWKMGPKITIDSASLMNKGLEVIEAHHLFQVDYDRIKVIIQPESVIHSMVELVDGSFLGHLGAADMRIPIQYALTFPQRFDSPAAHLDFTKMSGIHFANPDLTRFPALQLAYQAGRAGGTLPAVLNAANEVAVHSFLNNEIGFTDIARLVEKVMNRHTTVPQAGLDDIFAADAWAREACRELIQKGESH